MGDKTGIEWTDATWNPLRGCTRVSEGCRNCYAEGVAARFSGVGQPYEGIAAFVGAKREPRWTGKVALAEHLLDQPLRWKKPRRIFVNSMSDLFHESVPDEWIDRVFAVMALAPQHTFQVLTKRPERMRRYMSDPRRPHKIARALVDMLIAGKVKHGEDWPVVSIGDVDDPDDITLKAWPLPNVWLGASVEDQATADERIPFLLATPAAKRFVSAEPLLGPVDLERVGTLESVRAAFPGVVEREAKGRPKVGAGSISGAQIDAVGSASSSITFFQTPDHMGGFTAVSPRQWPRLDWVIVGGESGPNARDNNFIESARSLLAQCSASGVAFFGKQNVRKRHLPADLMRREFPA